MTNKEYRAAEGISKSDLFEMRKSPLHFKYKLENPEKDTPALIFGRAAHKAILEPETFADEFAIVPNIDRRTKAGKEAYTEFEEISKGMDFISEAELEKILEMSKRIEEHPTAKALLTGDKEQSFFWIDDLTGERCKCRPDCFRKEEDRIIIVDYKTTDSCQPGYFERSAKKYGYQLQAAMYCEGVFQNTLCKADFYFIAQEKTAPYAVNVYRCSDEYIAEGYDQFRELIGLYHKCKEADNWPGYEYNGTDVVELLSGE